MTEEEKERARVEAQAIRIKAIQGLNTHYRKREIEIWLAYAARMKEIEEA